MSLGEKFPLMFKLPIQYKFKLTLALSSSYITP